MSEKKRSGAGKGLAVFGVIRVALGAKAPKPVPRPHKPNLDHGVMP